MIRRAARSGLDGLVITEHHYLWSSEDLENARAKAGVSQSFVILAAQEVETNLGHVLVYGADRTITGKTTLAHIRKTFPDSFLVWAHPWRDGRTPSTDELLDPLLDGIEILNGNQSLVENFRGFTAWHELQFRAIGGSDVHTKKRVAIYPTVFDHPVSDIRSLIRQMRNGNARPLYTECREPLQNGIVVRGRFGSRMADRNTHYAAKKITRGEGGWKDEKNKADLVERIRRNGFEKGNYRIPRLMGLDEHSKTIIWEKINGQSLGTLLPSVHRPVRKILMQAAIDWMIHLHTLRLHMSSLDETRAREEQFFCACRCIIENIPHRFRVRFEDVLCFVEQSLKSDLNGSGQGFVQIHGNFSPETVLFGYESVFSQKPAYVSAVECDNTVFWDPAYDLAGLLACLDLRFWKKQDLLADISQDELIARWAEGVSIANDESLRRRIALFTIRANFGIIQRMITLNNDTSSTDFKWLIKRILNGYKSLK